MECLASRNVYRLALLLVSAGFRTEVLIRISHVGVCETAAASSTVRACNAHSLVEHCTTRKNFRLERTLVAKSVGQ